MKLVDRTENAVTIKSDNNNVVITARPLKVEFYNGDNVVAVVNARGLFALEHLRPKQPEKYVLSYLAINSFLTWLFFQ